MPGLLEGTQRYLVEFDKRPFDLSALRDEMHGARRPARAAELIARYESQAQQHQAAFRQHVQGLGGTVTDTFWLVNGCVIELAPEKLGAARDFANVLRIEADRNATLAAAPIRASTDKNNHRTDELQARKLTGAGIAIAILDSGHDSATGTLSRPHLTYSRRGSTTSSRLLFNKQMGKMPADDIHGHGTAVASVAAGWRWNSSALADHGHAYDADIAGYALADDVNARAPDSIQAKAWQQVVKDAAAHKIRVANISYHGSPDPQNLAQQALDAAALNADLLICASAGNYGNNLSNSQVCVNGLSVANVFHGLHLLDSNSSRGILDGQVFPDIAASGMGIYMAKVDDESANRQWTGTSFSSPQVAGIATVIRAAHAGIKADECKAVLLAASKATPETKQVQAAGPGCGFLDAVDAEAIAGNALRHGRATLTLAQPSWDRALPVTKGKTYRVAIAWHRKDVSKNTWTRIRLELRDGSSALAFSDNQRNTEQFIRFTAPFDGVVKINVVAMGTISSHLPQDFAWACNEDTSDYYEDLVVDSHSISSTTLKPASRYLGKFVIKNQGLGYSVSAKNGLYLSGDPVITTADRFLGWIGVGGMTGGLTQARQLWFTMPSGTPSTVYFGVITDYDTRVAEASELNNASPGIKCTVQGSVTQPDLQSGVSISSKVAQLVAGTTVTINAGTQNRGSGAAAPSTMGIWIGKRLVKRIDVPALAASQTFGGPYTCRVPNCIPQSSLVTVQVRADILSQVVESSEVNNDSQLSRSFEAWDVKQTAPSLEYVPTLAPGVDIQTASVQPSKGAKLQMCFQVPSRLNSQFYLLFWSFSKPPKLDAATDLSLSLLNGPIFTYWFSKTPPSIAPQLNLPVLPPLGKFSVYTHRDRLAEHAAPRTARDEVQQVVSCR